MARKVSKKAAKVISRKISEVTRKGVRGRKAVPGQAAAIGLETARRRGFKVPKRRA